MKKYPFVFLLVCLPILLFAQKIDTVKRKLAKLPYNKCEILPFFKEGNIDRYVANNFNRPKNIKSYFEGDVLVSMHIDSLGNTSAIQLVKNQSFYIDKEVKRILGTTKWEPAIYDSKPIDYYLLLHVIIKNDSTNGIFKVSTYFNYRKDPDLLQDSTNSNKIYTSVDQEPTFPGGMDAFYEYLRKEIVYPKYALEHKIQGAVYMTFTVEKDGALADLTIVYSPDKTLSLEALRVMKACPNFIPGIKNQKSVRAEYTMPINFVLKK